MYVYHGTRCVKNKDIIDTRSVSTKSPNLQSMYSSQGGRREPSTNGGSTLEQTVKRMMRMMKYKMRVSFGAQQPNILFFLFGTLS